MNSADKIVELLLQKAGAQDQERASLPEIEALAKRGRELLSAFATVIDRTRKLVEVANAADLPTLGGMLSAIAAVNAAVVDCVEGWERRAKKLEESLAANARGAS